MDGAEAIAGWTPGMESADLLDVDEIRLERSDWLNLRRNGIRTEGPSPWRLTRLSGMVCTIAAIALAVVTFSTGNIDPSFDLSAEVGSAPTGDAAGDTSLPPPAENEPEADEPTDPLLLALASSLGDDDRLISFNESTGRIGVPTDTDPSTTTSNPEITTTLVEPVIEPEGEWVDAGNGVRLPDVLLRIRFCESTNNYQAAHSYSSARGAYQFLTKSWNWYGHAQRYGVAAADLATPAQQDEAALLTLQRDGTRPWLASRSCWASPNIDPRYATVKPRSTTTTTAASTTTTPSGSSTSTTEAQTTVTTASTSTSTTASTTTTSTTASTTSTTAATTSSTTTSSSTSSTTATG